MKWDKVKVFKYTSSGVDELGNDIQTLEFVNEYEYRNVSWTSNDINLLGRELTSTSNKLQIMGLVEAIDDLVIAEIDNQKFTIEGYSVNHRFTSLFVSKARYESKV